MHVCQFSCVKIMSAHLKRIIVIIACDLWMESDNFSGHHRLGLGLGLGLDSGA